MLPSSPAAQLPGRGGITGGEGRWGGCKEKGLLSYSLSPNVSQRTGVFCSSPRSLALPAASRHLPTPSSTERRVLPDTSWGQNPLPWAGVGQKKKNKGKTPPFPPSFPPFPKTKDCKYCRLPLASCRSPAPQPSHRSWHGMRCGREGRRKVPGFPAGTCWCGWDASPKEALVRERAKDETAPPTPKHPCVLPFLAVGHSQPHRDPVPAAGLGGGGLWVMAKLNAWFTREFEGLLPSIS